jgi:predicted double-glycine peptidase
VGVDEGRQQVADREHASIALAIWQLKKVFQGSKECKTGVVIHPVGCA